MTKIAYTLSTLLFLAGSALGCAEEVNTGDLNTDVDAEKMDDERAATTAGSGGAMEEDSAQVEVDTDVTECVAACDDDACAAACRED